MNRMQRGAVCVILVPLGKRTEVACQRSGTVPIFAEALRSENGAVPFTPAGGMPPDCGCLIFPLALDDEY